MERKIKDEEEVAERSGRERETHSSIFFSLEQLPLTTESLCDCFTKS